MRTQLHFRYNRAVGLRGGEVPQKNPQVSEGFLYSKASHRGRGLSHRLLNPCVFWWY